VVDPIERPDPGAGKSLTRREFDEVIRRASELAARESDAGEGALEETELLRIANEVGLDERHVRAALMELRTGATMHRTGGAIERFFGPETVRASRVVAGTPRQLAEKLDTFLVGGQLLQSVRRTERLLQYRPAVDWASQVARMASAASRSYYVAAARLVEVRLEELEPGRTLVDFEVDPGTRNDALGGAAAGGFVGAAGGVGAAFALMLMAGTQVELAVAGGTLIATGVGGFFVSLAARSHRRKLRDVLSEVEGILDKLETGESLEPPPPAWRQWVKRHFHGVAKDFLITRDK
jgi:hypothetical protein